MLLLVFILSVSSGLELLHCVQTFLLDIVAAISAMACKIVWTFACNSIIFGEQHIFGHTFSMNRSRQSLFCVQTFLSA